MRSKIILIGLLFITLVFISFSGFSSKESEKPSKEMVKPAKTIVLGFYNVENLFDTINDPVTADDEFTPGTEKDWNSERYEKKINDLGMVIENLSQNAPAIIGLCEVENQAVVQDLISSEPLTKSKYNLVHYDSPDGRGIDVALIYSKKAFKPLYSEAVAVTLPMAERPTRDILYVKGQLKGGLELHVFVNHWPSRYGGAEESEPKRLAAAGALKTKIDSLMVLDPNTAIICMGDFNDYPDNKSVSQIIGAKAKGENGGMTNLMFGLYETQRGSYNYKGKWDFLDQIIVSPVLVNEKLPMVVAESTGPKFFDGMLYTDEKYKDEKPSRTYGGPNYYGGYSDHLPVATTIAY